MFIAQSRSSTAAVAGPKMAAAVLGPRLTAQPVNTLNTTATNAR